MNPDDLFCLITNSSLKLYPLFNMNFVAHFELHQIGALWQRTIFAALSIPLIAVGSGGQIAALYGFNQLSG